MTCLKFSVHSRALTLMTLLFATTTHCTYGQELIYPYYYRVYLRDKGDNTSGKYSAHDLLSSRAVNRRRKAGIKVPDFRDIPVNKTYLNKITQLGLKLHTTSKWMNTALFKSQSAFDINALLNLPYVSNVKIVKTPVKNNGVNKKLDFQIAQTDFITYNQPLIMINGLRIHDSGYDGKNILIAILDGGFLNSDVISSLSGLRSRKGIRKTYDFVKNSESVYNASTHGTAVLSIMAGKITGQIEGSAPGADYLLLKTEDIESEFPCEEDFWAAGAEYADSAGVDIISSSLGYFNFDDPSLNYKYSDLDGNTAFVTRVADIAASKGILVVNSAGNERDKLWKNIIFPSDGDSVLAVGAVDGNGSISDFSSSGPAADNRIKPDNVAMGVSVTIQISENLIGHSNGTSFSCPVLSGIAACLIQAVPLALNSDIINVLHSSADRYNFPDSLYGYGIPDIVLALNELQKKYVIVPDEGIRMYPNPTTGQFEITFSTPPRKVTIEIISLTGKLLFEKEYADHAGRSIIITDLQDSPQGMYMVRITDPSRIHIRKIIKLKN
jgi:serine protease AprX